MSEHKVNIKKIAKEITKSQPDEKAEHSTPIQIEPKKGLNQRQTEDNIRDTVVGWFNDWENVRRSRESVWTTLYKKYFTVIEKTKVPTRSEVTHPIAFQVTEAALPKIINPIFNNENKFFEVQTLDPDDTDDKARAAAIQRLLELQLDKAEFFRKFVDFSKQLLIYGTAFMKVFWDVERKWTWERTPDRQIQTSGGNIIGETIKWKETKQYRVTKRQPGIQLLDILDVYFDPDARTEQDGRGVFIRSWISKAELKELGEGRFPVYGNTDRLDEERGNTESYQDTRALRFASRGISHTARNKKNEVELLEFWGTVDLDGDGIKEECVIVIADRQVIVKGKANPFHHQRRPIIRGVMAPVPDELYGLGLLEPVLTQIDELNTIKRQRLDNINQNLNSMWQVDPSADVELDTLISGPNQIVLAALDSVRKLDGNDSTANAFNEAAQLQQEIERATAPSSIQGTPESGRLGRTKGGAQLIIGQALQKFTMSTKLLEEMSLRPLLDMIYALDLQFIDTDDVLQSPFLYREIADFRLTPEDIRANITFKLVGISEMIGSEAKINQMVSFMSIFGKVLAPESIESIAKTVWKLMGFPAKDITLVGAQMPPGTENTVDPSLGNAIAGQATNQGTTALPSLPQG